jgi:hypothetical protein
VSRLDEIKARAEQVHWTSTSIEQATARMASSAADVPWLVGQVESLERWKFEACEVMSGLRELGKALGLGLGVQITGPAALVEVERLTAERDALAAQVARAESLAEEWSAELDENRCPAHAFPGCDCHEGYHHAWDDLRAALGGSEADTTDVDVCSGDADCTSELHVHGCYADATGPCTDPDEHQPTEQEAE